MKQLFYKIFFIYSALGCCCHAMAQNKLTMEANFEKRKSMNFADSLVAKKNYEEAFKCYSKILNTKSYISFKDVLKIAEVCLKNNQENLAFQAMGILVNDLHFSNDDYINTSRLFVKKVSDPKWMELFKKIKENKERFYDAALANELLMIYKSDQDLREKLYKIRESKGASADSIQNMQANIARRDSMNIDKIQQILDSRGWPHHSAVWENSVAIFLVLQHAPLSIQKKYFPIIKNATIQGYINTQAYAMFEDRVNLGSGKPQRYGTQLMEDTVSRQVYLLPLQQVDSVDQFRQQVGLGPLRDYLKDFGINWSKDYYQQTYAKSEQLLNKSLYKEGN